MSFSSLFWLLNEKSILKKQQQTANVKRKIIYVNRKFRIREKNMWRASLQVLELGIGVSCCPKPTEEMLSSIWARTRPGLIGLLNGLQGIHVFVSNINGQKAQVTIKELGNDVKLYVDQYGHMWHLLAKGTWEKSVPKIAIYSTC